MNVPELRCTLKLWDSAKESGEKLWIELDCVQITFLICCKNVILAIQWRLTLDLHFVSAYGENSLSYWKYVCYQKWQLWECLTQIHTEEETLIITTAKLFLSWQQVQSLLTGSVKEKIWFDFTDGFDRWRRLWTDFGRWSWEINPKSVIISLSSFNSVIR